MNYIHIIVFVCFLLLLSNLEIILLLLLSNLEIVPGHKIYIEYLKSANVTNHIVQIDL